MKSFNEFGLLGSIQDTLSEKKIFKPTEIQVLAIPLLMSSQSVVGIAETGSGKTLTYALPLLHHLKVLENEGQPVVEPSKPRAIVMLPTRDLGEQVAKVFKTMTHHTRLRVRAALGGMDLAQAKRNIGNPFEILVATPGRLIQLLDLEIIDLSDVRLLIFDEADQMLDQGFLNDSTRIVEACPRDIQPSLFTATISAEVQELINELFSTAEVVQTAGSGKVVATLTTHNRTVKDGKRWPLFESILAKPIKGGTLVFTNTREQCDKLAKELTDKGYKCAIYRGEMEKQERRMNLRKFREGEIDLLVSTDLASRGLDLEHVGRVINFHLPQQMENYLHRVGRTARAGRPGLVINLVTERDERLICKLEGKTYTPPTRGNKAVKTFAVTPRKKDDRRTGAKKEDTKKEFSTKVAAGNEGSRKGLTREKILSPIVSAKERRSKSANKPASKSVKNSALAKKTFK
jgi:superfamily II DNA/RNA helicase